MCQRSAPPSLIEVKEIAERRAAVRLQMEWCGGTNSIVARRSNAPRFICVSDVTMTNAFVGTH